MSTFVVHPTIEQEKAVKEFLESQNVSFETDYDTQEIPEHVWEGIRKGQEDFKAGRFITLEQFKERLIYTKNAAR